MRQTKQVVGSCLAVLFCVALTCNAEDSPAPSGLELRTIPLKTAGAVSGKQGRAFRPPQCAYSRTTGSRLACASRTSSSASTTGEAERSSTAGQANSRAGSPWPTAGRNEGRKSCRRHREQNVYPKHSVCLVGPGILELYGEPRQAATPEVERKRDWKVAQLEEAAAVQFAGSVGRPCSP